LQKQSFAGNRKKIKNFLRPKKAGFFSGFASSGFSEGALANSVVKPSQSKLFQSNPLVSLI